MSSTSTITVHVQDTPGTPEQTITIAEPSRPSSWQRSAKTGVRLLKQYWFLLGLGTVIGLAWAFPQVGKSHGDIEAQYTVKWGAVIIIFLLSGLGLEVRVMLRTILQYRLHLVVQIINFVFMPFIMYGIVRLLIAVCANVDQAVYQGFMVAMSTCTTVSSNAVMTRNAGGNDSAALVNAALGNILGIFISPALIRVFGDDSLVFTPGARGRPDYLNVLKNLGLMVLLPLVVGQVIRFFFPKQVKYLAEKLHFSIINSLALLAMVWSVFCDGVASDAFHQMSGVDIVAIIGIDLFMYLLGSALCFLVARVPWPTRLLPEPKIITKWRFSTKDTVAIMYCGATKTVSMGILLINVMYADQSYGTVGVLSLPLLMYHIVQLFVGNFQVPILKRYVKRSVEEEGVECGEIESTRAAERSSLPNISTNRRRPAATTAASGASLNDK